MTHKIDAKVVEILQGGGVGLLPSDTIYGLSCRALDEKAVKKIYALKGRAYHKPLIVLISDLKMLDSLGILFQGATLEKEKQRKLLEKYWPRPVTLILPAPKAPPWLQRGTGSLAIRWPADQKLQKLIAQTGPLVSTSANPEGESPARTIHEAQNYFADKLDFYVDAGQISSQPSTIVRVGDSGIEIIRPGATKL